MADGGHVIFVGKPLTPVGKKKDRRLRSDKKDAMLKSMMFNPFPWVWEGHTHQQGEGVSWQVARYP